jgi:hypothetical protein
VPFFGPLTGVSAGREDRAREIDVEGESGESDKSESISSGDIISADL